MIEDSVKLFQAAAENKELWGAQARCVKAQYDALRNVGFTPSQAMEYLSRQGLGFTGIRYPSPPTGARSGLFR